MTMRSRRSRSLLPTPGPGSTTTPRWRSGRSQVGVGTGRVQRVGVPRPEAEDERASAGARQALDPVEGREGLPRHRRARRVRRSGLPAPYAQASPGSSGTTCALAATRPTASRPGWSPPRSWPSGCDEQNAEFVPRFLAAGELCCQLFSEPGAGSDLAVTLLPRPTATATSGSSTGRRCGARAPCSRSGAS